MNFWGGWHVAALLFFNIVIHKNMSYNKSVPAELDEAIRIMSNFARRFVTVNDYKLWEPAIDSAVLGIVEESTRSAIATLGETTIRVNTEAVLRSASIIARHSIDIKGYNHFELIHCGEKWDAPFREKFAFGPFTSLNELWNQFSRLKMSRGGHKMAFYMVMNDVFGSPFPKLHYGAVDAGYFLTVKPDPLPDPTFPDFEDTSDKLVDAAIRCKEAFEGFALNNPRIELANLTPEQLRAKIFTDVDKNYLRIAEAFGALSENEQIAIGEKYLSYNSDDITLAELKQWLIDMFAIPTEDVDTMIEQVGDTYEMFMNIKKRDRK